MENTARKQLARDAKRVALRRMEDAARTVSDFESVTKQWDHLDANRERKERHHELLRSEEMLTWGASSDARTVPVLPYDFVFWRQMMAGNFLDMIYACPYEMHELVEDVDVSVALQSMGENHQEILWFWAVRLYNSQRLAAMRSCTERNIRKTRELMLEKLRDRLAPRLQRRVQSCDLSVTRNMQVFLEWYGEAHKTALDKKQDD